MCGTVYGEMHLKDLLGSFIRVGYRIPVPDLYLVLHGLRCRKSTNNGLNQTKDERTYHVFYLAVTVFFFRRRMSLTGVALAGGRGTMSTSSNASSLR